MLYPESLRRLFLFRISNPFFEPSEDFMMPPETVLRVEHPMIFVLEVEESRGDTSTLQSCEGGNPLHIGHSEVCAIL